MLPPRSPDLHPIENLFGYLKAQLLQHLTKTLQQLRRQVRKLFNDLPDHYLAELGGSTSHLFWRRGNQVLVPCQFVNKLPLAIKNAVFQWKNSAF